MNDSVNPYQPPESRLVKSIETGEFSGPRRVPAGHALEWIKEGWRYFKVSPLNWILVVLVWIGGSTLLSFIPGVSLLMNLLFPLLIAGIMLGCIAIDRGEAFSVGSLFSAFKIDHRARLLGLGGVYVGSAIAAVIIVAAMFFATVGLGGALSDAQNFEAFMLAGGFWGVAVSALVVVALMIPLMMALWFAPMLIAIHDKSLGESLKLSFSGCLKNIIPFLIYGILMAILMIIGMIPAGLGLLVVMPVALGAMWASYKDIFLA